MFEAATGVGPADGIESVGNELPLLVTCRSWRGRCSATAGGPWGGWLLYIVHSDPGEPFCRWARGAGGIGGVCGIWTGRAESDVTSAGPFEIYSPAVTPARSSIMPQLYMCRCTSGQNVGVNREGVERQ